MDVFSALADPTRRKIIELLADSGQLPAAEIAAHFPVSAPAISQHLKVLQEAGLVSVERRAQQRIYSLDPQAMLEMEDWSRRLRHLWNRRFDALEILLEQEMRKEQQHEQE
ncbi:MAG: transcriptional regulator [Chloroflexi bacterium RBG_16_57_11]|nr:MAG: transcriptional regulator [Chloroflexi bacterium RBG_16_57_11]